MPRILLVDDNETFRASVRAVLEHAGYDVVEAGNGREALHKYSECPADLIITDMVMPGMNGMETMLELWRDFPQARFIAISGSAHAFNTEFNLECAKEFGALSTFTKPIEREPFLKAVARALGADHAATLDRTYSSLGHEIPPHRFGLLREHPNIVHDGAAMREALDNDGYLLLRGVLRREDVMAAREEVFRRLAEVGEIRPPAIEGIPTGTSRRVDCCPDLGAFWRSVCEGPAIRRVTHGGPMLEIMARILDGPVRPFDFLWLRAMVPGRASAFHFDHVYMNRGTDRLFTVWTPLGDVPLEDGPMLLVEGSHRWDDLISEYRGFDVDKDKSRPGHVTMDPVVLAEERGCRLLSTNFRAGDMLIVTMFMLHGSLDNRSALGRVRLSCDTRYQRADEPIDPRFVGNPPLAHGESYGGVSGARPLTAELIRR